MSPPANVNDSTRRPTLTCPGMAAASDAPWPVLQGGALSWGSLGCRGRSPGLQAIALAEGTLRTR